jgi:hypothetical protein
MRDESCFGRADEADDIWSGCEARANHDDLMLADSGQTRLVLEETK